MISYLGLEGGKWVNFRASEAWDKSDTSISVTFAPIRVCSKYTKEPLTI